MKQTLQMPSSQECRSAVGQQLMTSFREIPLLNPEIPFSPAQVIASLVLEVPRKASELGPPKSLDFQQGIREEKGGNDILPRGHCHQLWKRFQRNK